MTDIAVLADGGLDLPAPRTQARRRVSSRTVPIAAVGALGLMHFARRGIP